MINSSFLSESELDNIKLIDAEVKGDVLLIIKIKKYLDELKRF